MTPEQIITQAIRFNNLPQDNARRILTTLEEHGYTVANAPYVVTRASRASTRLPETGRMYGSGS